MGRKKQPDFFKSIFQVQIKSNPIYGDVKNTTKALLSKTNFYGIGVKIEQTGQDTINVETRTGNAKYAAKDHMFVSRHLESFGDITLAEVWGHTTYYNRDKWTVYTLPEFYKKFIGEISL
jgi:hypothetical protein